jgi:hypothetical protein
VGETCHLHRYLCLKSLSIGAADGVPWLSALDQLAPIRCCLERASHRPRSTMKKENTTAAIGLATLCKKSMPCFPSLAVHGIAKLPVHWRCCYHLLLCFRGGRDTLTLHKVCNTRFGQPSRVWSHPPRNQGKYRDDGHNDRRIVQRLPGHWKYIRRE